MTTDILATALGYYDAGFTPIPIALDGSKSPATSTWRKFYKERPTRAQVERLFKGKECGLAILGGPCSGGLEVVDFDDAAAWPEFLEVLSASGAGDLAERLPLVRTPKGFHLYLRSDAGEGNRKLAMKPNPEYDAAEPKKAPKTLTKIETRGNGGYVVAPGSPASVHPSGKTYEPIGLVTILGTPTITAEERAMILDAARSLNEVAEHDEPERKHGTTPNGEGRPGDDFEQSASWDEILQPHGWKLVRRRGDASHWQRPGKSDKGISATTGVAGVGGKFYCFSSNAHPFEASHAYSKFRVYAFLNHAGDFASAARELKAKGYGERAKAEAARAAQRQNFAALNERLDNAFAPRTTTTPPPLDDVPMPNDNDAPAAGVVPMTAQDLERLLDDDRAAALIEPTFSRLLAARDDDAEWQRILFMLQRFKAVKLFQEKVKKHDKSARGRGDGADWKESLIYRENKSGEMVLESCLTNYITILLNDPKWRGVLAFDEFANQIVTRKAPPFKRQQGRWGDADALEVRSWLETSYGLRMTTQAVCEAILVVAKRCAFNALVEYLDSLQDHGGESVLDTWLIDFFGAPDTPYVRAVGAKWMIAAVARAYDPGCQVDTVLILEGKQGSKKSSVLKQLCPSFEWFTDGLSDFGSKAQAEEVEGKWIVELGEMKGFGKELEQIKAFITRRAENYRPAYARYSVHSPRKCVFAATVNPTAAGYLRDETGNRRYWPIECTKQAPTLTPELRDRMWAEAVTRYKAKEQWWIEDEQLQQAATVEQEKRVVLDPWHELIEAQIAGEESTSTDEILDKLRVETAKRGTSDLMRVGRIMTALKWEKYQQRWPDGRRTWRYRNPSRTPQPNLPLGGLPPATTHAA